jgi:hypothetical protein
MWMLLFLLLVAPAPIDSTYLNPPPLLLLSSTPKPFSRQVIRTLRRAGVLDKVGQDWVFVRVHDAVSYAQGLLAADKEGAHVVAKEDHDTITNKV